MRTPLRTGAADRWLSGDGSVRVTPGSAIFTNAQTLAVVGKFGQAPDFSAGPFVEPESL
jgi:hypothetical protein